MKKVGKLLGLLLVVILMTTACGNLSGNKGSTTSSDNSEKEYINDSELSTEKNHIQSTEGVSSEEIGTNGTDSTHEHAYSVEVVNATCAEDGYTEYACACGDRYKENIVKAVGHRNGPWEATKEPTTTSNGKAERKCEVCGKKETKTLNKIDANHKHSYNQEVVKPTCVATGYTYYECDCGYSYTSKQTNKTKHTYVEEVKESTCEKAGRVYNVCTYCGDRKEVSGLDVLGHDYVPTGNKKCQSYMQAGGLVEHKCARCGAVVQRLVEEGNFHEYEVTKHEEATCKTKGEHVETCKGCGDVNRTTLPAAHGELVREYKAPNCFARGYDKQVCKTCGSVQSYVELPAQGEHVYSKQIMSEAANKHVSQLQQATGLSAYIYHNEHYVIACEVCGYFDPATAESIYGTELDNCMYILGRVNELRREVYGSAEYDLVFDELLYEQAQKCAKIVYEEGYPWDKFSYAYYDAYYAWGPRKNFDAWLGTVQGYAYMVDIHAKYYAYASYYAQYPGEDSEDAALWTPHKTGTAVQLFWSEEDRNNYLQFIK